jgi:photosystem II stability/assembly factor-like uncharacterized protein
MLQSVRLFSVVLSLSLSLAQPALAWAPAQQGQAKVSKLGGKAPPGARGRAKGAARGRARQPRSARKAGTPALPPQPPEEFREDPKGRREWFFAQRAYPFGELPADGRRRAWEAAPRAAARGGAPAWRPLGPLPSASAFIDNWGLTSGRINAVAVSPADPRLILVGSATGGLWRSADGGANFSPVSDGHVDLAVGAIAFSRSNPDVVYAGMGDAKAFYLGTGILKSTDAGQTWARVSGDTLPAPGATTRIAVDPADPNRVYVAQFLGRDSGVTALRGVYVSADGGVTWRQALPGVATDLVLDPSDSRALYAAMTYVAGDDRPPGIYQSTDGGATWRHVFKPPSAPATGPYPPDFSANLKLATTSSDPARVYALSGGRGGLRLGFSRNGGRTWKKRRVRGVDPAQLTYNFYLAADPADRDTLYIGTRDLYKSTDAGRTWENLTLNFVWDGSSYAYDPLGSKSHPDQHAYAFAPDDPGAMYIGNDGGLSKSTDGGRTFSSLNTTLSLTQFYGLTLHPEDPAVSYGGTQDNGTQRRLGDSYQWQEFFGGDGGQCVVNPEDPAQVFTTYIRGFVFRFGNNGSTFQGTIGTNRIFEEPDSRPRIAFIAPFVGNGVDRTLYFGTWRLFVSSDLGETWTAPAGDLDLTRGGSDVLSRIAVAPADLDVIYTGSSQGRVMATADGGETWRDVTAGLPNRYISHIAVDAADPATVYVTVSGYGSGHVFKSVDGGANWADVSGDLPDVPVNTLLADPRDPAVLYAGTDVGVFRSTSGGVWESFNAGLPPVVVTALTAHPSGAIQLATYGRGAYELIDGGPEAGGFAISADRVSQSISLGGTATFTLKVQRIGAFDRSVRLAAAASPPSGRVTARLSSETVAPGGTATLTVTISDGPPLSTRVLVSGTAGGVTRTLPLVVSAGSFSAKGPRITGLSAGRNRYTISGAGFGQAPRVLVNGVDRTGRVRRASDAEVVIVGTPEQLGLVPGENHIQVTGAGGPISNALVFER